jgi:hypothetical protein
MLFSGPPPADTLQQLGGLCGEIGWQVGLKLKLRSAEHAQAFGDLMTQELAGVRKSLQCRFLFFYRAFQSEVDMRMAMIGRKIDLSNGHVADARVRQLIVDQLFQLFAEAFRKPFITMGVQRFQNNRSDCFS